MVADVIMPMVGRHRNMLFQWLFRCLLCHRKAVQWKHRIASTIMVLSLRRLRGEFPSRTYRMYHGTPAYGTCCSSRLIVVWVSTMVPNPRGTWYDGTVHSLFSTRRRHKYREPVAIGIGCSQRFPGTYLHVGYSPYVPIKEYRLETGDWQLEKLAQSLLVLAIRLPS